ncbi:MAG: hypothetical protein J5617_03665 [Bacilli bacterium]|nr:hypothetical protein [Bacilli bacterium]
MVSLRPYQEDAVKKMKNGCILCGDVGSGKSRTGLAYYFLRQGGDLNDIPNAKISKPLYIITTARKRDTFEWENELLPFGLTAKVDSWNNIQKYIDIRDAFFIFDEQRVVGSGKWSKSFIKIARNNEWILLTATPGDTWMDYIPVFIANGFYKNKTEFVTMHVIYSRFTKYPSVSSYVGVGRLLKLRNDILINMDYHTPANLNHITIATEFPFELYKSVMKTRQNPETGEPFNDASALCYYLRKIVNSSPDRIAKTKEIAEKHKRVIIFYSYDYELDILKKLFSNTDFEVAEWNGHRHEDLPVNTKWIYLVNYMAGAEGWNCIKTDTIIFYSQSYSYKTMVQASGRINRLNTPYKDLYYYHLTSHSTIDISIAKALKSKKTFNEKNFILNSR